MLERKQQLPQDEVEALNADVMRFMAILGLCLMLIFAAMEGVRVSSQEHMSDLDEVMSQQMQIIEHENEQIKKSLFNITEEKIFLNSALKATKSQLQQQEDNQLQILDKLNKTQEQSLSNLKSDMEQKISHLRQSLNTLKQERHIEKNETDQNKQVLLKKYNKAKSQVNQLNLQLAQEKIKQKKEVAAPQSKPSKAIKKKPVSKTQKKGFLLRFSNDDAFIQLLKQQRIKLIITSSEGHYQVKHNNTITKVPLQGKYEMYTLSNNTVPLIYKMVISSNSDKKWGVILPPDIRASLQNTMRQHQSGILEISAIGSVSIK